MKYKDVNCCYRSSCLDGMFAATFEQLNRVCDDNQIVVRALFCADRCGMTVRQMNERTLSLCRQRGDVPVLRLLPLTFPEECYTLDELARLAEQGAAFRIHPHLDAAPLKQWLFPGVFELFEQIKAPLLISLEEVDMDDLAALKTRHPGLVLVLTNTTQWMNRQYVQFVKTFPNVVLDISNVIEYYGLESLVQCVGAEKLLFGTGMPAKEPYDKIYQLLYSDLSSEQREMIAFGNFERIMERRCG